MEEQPHLNPRTHSPRPSDLPDSNEGGEFLSPEESQGILSDLELQDNHTIGNNRQDLIESDDSFVSPEEESTPNFSASPDYGLAEELSFDFEEQSRAVINASILNSTQRQRSARDNEASHALLARMSVELKTIKSELSALKAHFNHHRSAGESSQTEKRDQNPDSAQRASLPPETIEDLKRLLAYLDRLLESLPEDTIDSFAKSEYFELYRKVFEYFDLA
jgi:hypothetical protein